MSGFWLLMLRLIVIMSVVIVMIVIVVMVAATILTRCQRLGATDHKGTSHEVFAIEFGDRFLGAVVVD